MPFIEYVDAPAHSSSSGISGALMRRRIEYIDWRPPGDQSRRAGMLFPESIAERESISFSHRCQVQSEGVPDQFRKFRFDSGAVIALCL